MSDEGRFTLQELEALYAGDEEGLTEILSLFVQDAPERLDALRSGLESGDIPRAAESAHGIANLLGAVRNHSGVEAARETERSLNVQNLSEARGSAARCEKAVEAVLERIRERGV
jgi:HPt (histidine-containing phosphotransfer) domain-containing protein